MLTPSLHPETFVYTPQFQIARNYPERFRKQATRMCENIGLQILHHWKQIYDSGHSPMTKLL